MSDNNKILIQEVADKYPDLTLSQYRLLCFCAYCGKVPSTIWAMDLYDTKFNLPKGRSKKDLDKLTESGYLLRYEEQPIRKSEHMAIALLQMRCYPEWTHIFEELSRYRSDDITYIWNLAKFITGGDLKKAASLRYPSSINFWRYLEPIVLEHDEILPFIPGKDCQEMLRHMLVTAFNDETMDEEYLEIIEQAASLHLDYSQELEDICDTYRYYLSGKMPEDHDNRRTLWTLGRKAVATLISGQITEAMDLFSEALTTQKNVAAFPEMVLAWFHSICLLLCIERHGSLAAQTALQNAKVSSSYKFGDNYFPVRILLTYREMDSESRREYVHGELKKHLGKGSISKVQKHFARILCGHFGLSGDDFPELNQEQLGIPKAKILQNESAPFIALTSPERARLHNLFHGGSCIGVLPRKEDWELALSEVLSSRPESKEEVLPQRIIYFLEDGWINAIMEQTLSPDGEWKRERIISRKDFISGKYPLVDEIDIKLMALLGRKQITTPDAEVIVPLLAGSGRLFTGQHLVKPFQPLPSMEEKPRLTFIAQDGRIVVETNVKKLSDGKFASFSAHAEPDGTYVYTRTNPVQMDIITKLMRVREFPPSASMAVQNTAQSISGILEVSVQLEGLVPVPTVVGDSRIAIRIIPDDDNKCYNLTIQAAPDEGSPFRCDPGQGADHIWEENKVIVRDRQAEYDNYMEFRTFTEDELGLEYLSATHAELGATESLLSIITWAYDHRDKCFVEWPEGRSLRFRGTLSHNDLDITVKSNVNWFEMEGEVNLGKDRYTLEELLKAMRESSGSEFVRLSDKDFVRMTATLRRHLEELDKMIYGNRGRRITVPKYRVGHLAEILGMEGGLHAEMDDGFKDLLWKMQSAYDSTPEVPPNLNGILRDYQIEGFRWMKRLDAWGAGACLADDMGLGKTVQTIAFLLSKAEDGPSLVIAPKSVIPNWDLELARFAPSLQVRILNSEHNRSECIRQAGPNNVILCTYGVLGTRMESLASQTWNVICLDEAHQIKNRNTRVSAAAMTLQSESRIILTGTPLQNHLGELWNLFQFINPGLLGEWSDFKSKYLQAETDPSNQQYLKDLVQPFILRRTKEDVLTDLPEKIIYNQYVDLSDAEMDIYETKREFVRQHIKTAREQYESKPDDNVKVSFFAELTNLRLASCSMSLVHNEWTAPSSKTEALRDLIERIKLSSEGNRILIFSQFTSYLTQVRAMLDKEGYPFLYMDGQTDLDERQELVRKFQDGHSPIFVSSLKAGGLGLNLTAANYVILLDPWWNPAIEDQAMDRAHRIGQKRSVTVIRLISRHTIEEKILRFHESKRSLSNEILSGTADSYRLTMDDVLDMVSPFR